MSKALDKWWATEPFGFDHPDTYDGIKKLLCDERKATEKRVKKELLDKLVLMPEDAAWRCMLELLKEREG